MKKIISLLLVCLMILSMVTVVSAEAERVFTLSTSVSEVSENDVLTVTVDMGNMANAAGVRFCVAYDPNIFTIDTDPSSVATRPKCIDVPWYQTLNNEETYIGSAWGGLKPTYGFPTFDPSWIENPSKNEGNLNEGESGVSFVYSATASANVEVSQCVGKFSMTVKEGVYAGTTTVRLSFVELTDGDSKVIESTTSQDIEITVNGIELAKSDVTVSSNDTAGYTITGIPATAVTQNEEVSFVVKANEGYTLGDVKMGDTVLSGTNVENGTQYTFTMPAEDVNINVAVSKDQHAINTVFQYNGNPVDDGAAYGNVTYKVGEDIVETAGINDVVTVVADPSDPAAYNKGTVVSVTNATATDLNNDKFTMPNSDVTVTVNYTDKGYDITVEQPENGKVNVSTPDGTTYGKTIVLSNEPSKNYELGEYIVTTADGSRVTVTDSKFTLTENVTVTATFVKKVFEPEVGTDITAPVEPSESDTPETLETSAKYTLGDLIIKFVEVLVETVEEVKQVAGSKIEFLTDKITAGEPIPFKITPPEGKSVKLSKVWAKVDGTPVPVYYKGKASAQISLNAVDAEGEYEIIAPDGGEVEIGVDLFESTDTTAKVSVKYTAITDAQGTTSEFTEDLNVVDGEATLSKYASGEIAVTVTPNDAANGAVASYADKIATIASGGTYKYKYSVTAQDTTVTNSYEIVINNPSNPAGSGDLVISNDDAEFGKEFYTTISAQGTNSATGFVIVLQLPTKIIANSHLSYGVSFMFSDYLANDSGTESYKYYPETGKLYIDGYKSDGITAFDSNFEIGDIYFTLIDEETAAKDSTIVLDADGVYTTNITAENATYGNIGVTADIPFGTFAPQIFVTRSMDDIKQEAIDEVLNYLNEYDYSEQKWENDVAEAIQAALDAINAEGADEVAVATAVTTFKATADGIQKLADKIDTEGTPEDTSDDTLNPGSFKGEITTDAYFFKTDDNGVDGEGNATNTENDIVLTNYTEEDQAKINKLADDAQAAVLASQSRDEDVLRDYIVDAQDAVAAIPTIDQVKEAKKAEIDAAIDTSLYIDEALDTTVKDAATGELNGAVAEAIRLAKANIDADTKEADMTAEVEAFKALLPITASLRKTVRGTYTEAVENLDLGNFVANAGTADEETLSNPLTPQYYTDENLYKIDIYQAIAKANIAAATSEAAMKEALEDAKSAIAKLTTKNEAEKAALDTINTEDPTTIDPVNGYDIEDIVAALPNGAVQTTITDATTEEKVIDPSKEALYQAAIEDAKKNGELGFDDLSDAIVTANRAKASELYRGDFNVDDAVTVIDPINTLAYVCKTADVETLNGNKGVTLQGIVNADLHTPGDGVLTVFDVVEIRTEVKKWAMGEYDNAQQNP